MKAARKPTAQPGPLTGLRFAIYARKSNEDDRNPDHKSLARQVDQATAWVEKQGGVVLADQRYEDDAVSGAEFKKRPGLIKLMDAVKNGKPFNALVMSEQSRLGREQTETGYLLKQIRDAGVRVFYYYTGDEAKLNSAIEKIVSSLTGFAAEMEREHTSKRTRDSAERRFKQGHVTGGRCYGYQNVLIKDGRPAEPGEKADYVTRKIRPDEAAIVRGIFRMYADGLGMVKIVKTLNATAGFEALSRRYFGGRKIPTPLGRGDGWAPTLIRHILHREIYKGELVWAKVTHTDKDGRAGLCVKRPEQDWLRQPAPDLRIIPDALWAAVHARLKIQATTYLRDHRGKLWSQVDRGKAGRYLLSGLGRCKTCGSPINVIGGNPRSYGCPGASWKGICPNGWHVAVKPIDAAFLAALEREVLTPLVFKRAVQEAIRLVHEELAKAPDRIPALERERADLTRKIKRLIQAIENGGESPAIRATLDEYEARKKDVETELAAKPAVAPADLLVLQADAAVHLRRFATLLQGDVPLARQLLKKLIAGPIVFARQGNRLTFEAKLRYDAVLRECICVDKPGAVC